MISVLILSFNEEINILRCLDSVSWSDDVVVVDSFSTDRTIDLARSAGARIVQNPFVNFAQQRNFGLEYGRLKHDWILHLDADEVVTPELRREMTAVTETVALSAYRVASKLIFQEKWLRHASMYPCYQVRLGRRQTLTFAQRGHGQRETLPLEAIGTLHEPLLHYSFGKGLEEWFAKHNRYSTAEAEQNLKSIGEDRFYWKNLFASSATKRWRTLKELSIRMPFRPTCKFLYVYLWRLGFLDGVAGHQYCRMLRMYECMTVFKIKELRSRNKDTGASRSQNIS